MNIEKDAYEGKKGLQPDVTWLENLGLIVGMSLFSDSRLEHILLHYH